MKTYEPDKEITWDGLIESLNNSLSHPIETTWDIYYYLRRNYQADGSVISRTLMLAYLMIRLERPSLINSCMLGLALKISRKYADFNLPVFLDYWDYSVMLRPEDTVVRPSPDGKPVLTLKDRTERALQSYRLRHPHAKGRRDDIRHMLAVKVYAREDDGVAGQMVKLVDGQGMEIIADGRMFVAQNGEIQGRMFDVLVRSGRNGVERAVDVVGSRLKPEEVFATTVGYVGWVDPRHVHVHVFDSLSRHFVADHPDIMPCEGDFVKFCPVIANDDRFKSAAIVSIADKLQGRMEFGTCKAVVVGINSAMRYVSYRLQTLPPDTSEGQYEMEGTAGLSKVVNPESIGKLVVGGILSLTLYLRRGRDRVKHNCVAFVHID